MQVQETQAFLRNTKETLAEDRRVSGAGGINLTARDIETNTTVLAGPDDSTLGGSASRGGSRPHNRILDVRCLICAGPYYCLSGWGWTCRCAR